MSGSKDSHRILTFDWTNMEYTKHTSQLIGSRKRSACALLKGSDGVVLVAVASGYSAGMEVWNPADDSVKMLTSDFPKYASEFPQLISVNYHSELIFYESSASDGNPQGIWQYSTLTGNWTKIGDMLFSRGSFSVIPVDGVSCPDVKP